VENRQLFLGMLAELNYKLHAETEYEILGIARILRQFLLDRNRVAQAIISDQPLHLVGEGIPTPPRVLYEVAEYSIPAARDSTWWAVLDGLDPELEVAWRYFHGNRKRLVEHMSVEGTVEGQTVTSQSYPVNGQDFARSAARSYPRLSLKSDVFLRRVVIVYGRETFSVQDIVRYLANFGGAVHTGRAGEQRERALEAVMHQLYIGDLPLGVYMLLPIGRVVYRGLQVLREYVETGPMWQRAHWRIDIVPNFDGSAGAIARPVGGPIPLVPAPDRQSEDRVSSD
jgi:hypothetical protein